MIKIITLLIYVKKFLIFIKNRQDFTPNVIKLSSFNQRITLPELYKREKGGLFLRNVIKGKMNSKTTMHLFWEFV